MVMELVSSNWLGYSIHYDYYSIPKNYQIITIPTIYLLYHKHNTSNKYSSIYSPTTNNPITITITIIMDTRNVLHTSLIAHCTRIITIYILICLRVMVVIRPATTDWRVGILPIRYRSPLWRMYPDRGVDRYIVANN